MVDINENLTEELIKQLNKVEKSLEDVILLKFQLTNNALEVSHFLK